MIDEARAEVFWAGELSEYDQRRDTASYGCKDPYAHVLPHDRDPWPLSVKAVVATFGYSSSHGDLPKFDATPKGAFELDNTSLGEWGNGDDRFGNNVAFRPYPNRHNHRMTPIRGKRINRLSA